MAEGLEYDRSSWQGRIGGNKSPDEEVSEGESDDFEGYNGEAMAMDVQTFQNLLFPLLSCGVCGNIIVDPVTLQCGNTLCRTCLPGAADVSYSTATQSTGPYFWSLGSQYRENSSDGKPEKCISPTIQERFVCPFRFSGGKISGKAARIY